LPDRPLSWPNHHLETAYVFLLPYE